MDKVAESGRGCKYTAFEGDRFMSQHASSQSFHEWKSVPGSNQENIRANVVPMRFASRSNIQNPLPYRLSQHSLAKPIRKTVVNAQIAGQKRSADKVSQKLQVMCRRLSSSVNLLDNSKKNALLENVISSVEVQICKNLF